MPVRFGFPVAIVALVVVLSACGRSTPPKPPVVTSAPPTGVAGIGGAGSTPVPPRCAADNLAIVARDGGGAAGHHAVLLIFTNAGTGPCRFYGYPGVAGLDATGKQIEQAKRSRSGPLGGLAGDRPIPTVDVEAGQAASAMLEAAATRPDGGTCTPYAGLLVTPPDETRSFPVTWPSAGCADLSVHPIVAGVTGSLR